MTVIAMTREMGTLGKDVAAGIAERLGLEVIHHELVEHGVADRMHVNDSEVHRFLEGKPSMWSRWKIDEKRLSRFTAEEILSLASRDNVVIRGWGACALLHEVPHVLCVRICAPMAFRKRTMMQRLSLEDAQVAEREIRHNDAAHARALHHLSHADWTDPLNYDAVFNMHGLTVDDCVDQLALMAQSATFAKTEASQAALAVTVLNTRIRNALTQSDGPVGYDLDGGHVTLRGAMTTREGIDAVVRQVRAIEGVTEVDNKIMLMPMEA